MSDKNIYQILESLDAAQRGVKQLPALFKPKDTSPQLSGPYPGRNATLGYLVGEGDETGWGSETGDSGADETPDGVSPDTQSFLDEEEQDNPMRQAVTRRIVNQHPEWITRYGVEFLMQVIDDVTEGETDWEEIGSSDVSAFVNMVGDQLRDRGGSREEMDDRRPFAAKGVAEDGQRYKFQRIKFRGTDHDIGEERYVFTIDGNPEVFNFSSDEDNPDPDSPSFEEILARVQRDGAVEHLGVTPAEQQAIAKKIAAERQRYLDQRRPGVAEGIMKSLATRLIKGAANRQTPQEIANTHVRALNQRAPGTRMQGHPNFADFKREVHSYISAAQNGEQAFARTTDDHVKSLFKKYFSEGVSEGHADQQRTIIKRNGQPVGEVGVDRESSPGAGMYYMKHYASGLDLGGYDSREEAMDELRYAIKQGVAESKNTTEDVISTVKKKLGDYLSDLSKEIKSDPDLKDKLERDIDQIGPAVKTLKTDDGHEIKIHGNEDDGFRITIKNREAKTRFRDLDEATMAVEMYCARRRGAVMEKDYLEER